MVIQCVRMSEFQLHEANKTQHLNSLTASNMKIVCPRSTKAPLSILFECSNSSARAHKPPDRKLELPDPNKLLL